MTVEPMTDAELAEVRQQHGKWGLSANPTSNVVFDRLFARLDAERSRADAAEAERDAAVAREAEREADADGWFLRAVAAIGKLPAETLIGDLQAAYAEAEARLLPKPRLMRTVEEVEALPSGDYLIRRHDEMAAAPWRCTRNAPTPWRTVGTGHGNGDLYFIGAWISGPLPSLPTPTAAQEG